MPDERIPRPVDEELFNRFRASLRMHLASSLGGYEHERAYYHLPPRYVAVSVDRAIPLLIDQALLVAGETGAVPLTDDPFIATYMVQRFANMGAFEVNRDVVAVR
jgi:hypothetical protein